MTKTIRTTFAIVLTGCSVCLPALIAIGQAPVQPVTATGAAAPPPAGQQDSQRTAAVILVKNALLAVNQGNLTGNYTVLRDLASPGFREKNSAADLAAIFHNVRQQRIDLSPIVVLDPVLNLPRMTPEGQLALEGYFSTNQLRINFQLLFIKANTSGWMIHGVSLNAVPEAGAVASSARR